MSKTVTLRRKFLTWVLLPMLILWFVSASVMYYLSFRFVNYAFDYALMDSTQDLAAHIVSTGDKMSLDLPKIALQLFLSDKMDRIYYSVSTETGTVLSGDHDLPRPSIKMEPGTSILHDGSLRQQKVRIASFLFLPPGLPSDRAVLIQVAETLNKRNVLAGRIITTTLLLQLLLIVIASCMGWIGIGRGLSPLKQLHRELSKRSHRDLSPVNESVVPAEVRSIIHEINELMKRLGESIKMQQRFIADAAHQLRTPLSGLKAQASLALRQSDPISMRHSLDQLNASADHTIRLINQMLALAQVEPGGTDKESGLTPLDMDALVREITKEWVPFAFKKNIDLGYEGPNSPAVIQGDAVRIKMMIDNLIDNALRYSAQGSSVTTRVESVEKTVVLTVEDNGPGIPPTEREVVFQRFYRVLGTPSPGSGLGLSIVHEVAESHGAHVTLNDPIGHSGTCAKVIFPLAPTL